MQHETENRDCTLLCLHPCRLVRDLILVGCLKQHYEHTRDFRCTTLQSMPQLHSLVCQMLWQVPVEVHDSQQVQSHECRSEIKGALEEVATASHQCSLLSRQHQGLLQRQQATLPDPDPLADQVCPSAPDLHANKPACHMTLAAGTMYMMCSAIDAHQAFAHT